LHDDSFGGGELFAQPVRRVSATGRDESAQSLFYLGSFPDCALAAFDNRTAEGVRVAVVLIDSALAADASK